MRTGRQKLGQHFLVRGETVERIVQAAQVAAGDGVLEIGPGRGILTDVLLARGARVTAIELDRRLYENLLERYRAEIEDGRLRLKHIDFLKIDPSDLPRPVKIAANLPYSVAAPILQKILDWDGWKVAVLMFQKEVAERILAAEGNKKYGLLGISVAIKADAEPVCDVPARDFSPPPKVDSAVVRFTRLAQPRLPGGLPEEKFFAVVRAAFGHRRKTLANSLMRSLDLPREPVESALRDAGIELNARAEDVPVHAFIALANKFS